MRELFAIALPECAAPAFCSLSKIYVGELDDLYPIINRLRSVPGYEDTVEAFDEYLMGNRQAAHRVAYAWQVILEPVKELAQKKIHLGETAWEHLNIWGCPYNVGFSQADIERVAIRYHGEHLLYCRAKMMDLCYEVENDRHNLDGGFWGNEYVMDITTMPDGHYTVSNLLFIKETSYDTEEQMMAALADDSTIQFKEIMNEVFGDG